jgi:hypothetical protein
VPRFRPQSALPRAEKAFSHSGMFAMIDFPCTCGNSFSLPDDQAGGSLQCPKCGLLVSVPTLDDLRNLDADGAYTLDFAPTEKDRRAEERIHPVGARRNQQPEPEEIPLEADPTAAPITPRYDPFTGELIRAITVEKHVQSVAAKTPTRTQPISKLKDRGKVTPPPKNSWLVLLGEMCMAHNVFVLLVMTVLNVLLGAGLFVVISIRATMFFFMPTVLLMVCFGYFSLIVQETGPGEKEELPRPLREFELKSDIWEPFLHFALSVVPCLLPAAIIYMQAGDTPAGRWISAGLAVAGAFFFPAMFMSLSINGVVANLRPDRVLGVIFKAGWAYLPVPIAWSMGLACIVNGMAALYNSGVSLFDRVDPDLYMVPVWNVHSCLAAVGFIIAGLYLSYYACWQLAMIWRKHHREFPWVAQRFKTQPPAPPPSPKAPKRSNHKPA